MRVVLLHDRLLPDSRPDEADALVQAEAIATVLRERGATCEFLPVSLEMGRTADELQRIRPQLVFNLVESVNGQGRFIHFIPALLEALDLPFTGAGAEAMFVTSDKLLAKRLLVAEGLPTPPWIAMRSTTAGAPVADHVVCEPELPARLIIKSVWEDASLGLDDSSVVLARDRAALLAEIERRAPRLGGEALAELFVEGREFNLSLLEIDGQPQVLPIAEIEFVDFPQDKPRIVGYAAKWDEASLEYRNTPRQFSFADRDQRVLADLRRLAIRAWEVFGLRGYARIDFRVDQHGQPWIIEANANPCLSPDAGFMAAAARADLSLAEVVARIVVAARPRH